MARLDGQRNMAILTVMQIWRCYFDRDTERMILDKYDNEMLIWFRSDSELSVPVNTSQSATESQLADWTECKNNTKLMIDTPNNVTVYFAKLPETYGYPD